MSDIQNILITLSLISWLILIVIEFLRKTSVYRVMGFFQLFLLLIFAWGLQRWFGYFNTIEIRTASIIGEGVTLVGLYVSTVLGIIGHHIFIQTKGLKEKGRQPKLKWMPLLKPLVISPLIFMAVLNQLP